jgi:aspartate carbamoyltransferase catalytic subunit
LVDTPTSHPHAPSGAVRHLTNSTGLKLDPRRLLDRQQHKIDFEPLAELEGKSVTGHGSVGRQATIELARFSSLLEITEVAQHHPLDGKVVITAFFEASTRTRLSFESAVLRLDGKVLSVPDGRVTGIAKGESMADIGEMFNSYGDLVVLRHPHTESLAEIQENLTLPIINAGNGSGEHPTQALVDWYALLKWRPSLALPEPPEKDRIHLGIVGTPGNMRAVKSFLFLALDFMPAIRKITIVSEMADPLGVELAEEVERRSVSIEVTNDVNEVLEDLDVIYMNSIALLGDSYRELDSRYKLNADTPLKDGSVVLHPLARREELDTSLDATEHNLYFAQAAGAVYMRQALLICMLGRLGALPPSIFYLTS